MTEEAAAPIRRSPVPTAPWRAWLVEPLTLPVRTSVDRLRRADDVRYLALMPDVHLASEVCVGTVIATRRLIYPLAVGSDIGCGMAALAFNVDVSIMDDERSAAKLLAALYQSVPGNKHRSARTLPESLRQPLSDATITKRAARDGRVQLGTLGRGNHFLELQADQERRLWVMVHSGSRAMGQVITAHHLRLARDSHAGLKWLDATDAQGAAYLADVRWACEYARENRIEMLRAVEEYLRRQFRAHADWETLIHADHNHVRQESHWGDALWVHRKGAQSAATDEPGIVPGSMGAVSMHTLGRGCEDALKSCSHGAGRRLSRTEARRKVKVSQFARQVGSLWYDHRRARRLRDEAPSAYKDIRAVMRAQRELVKIERELRPLLSYKA